MHKHVKQLSDTNEKIEYYVCYEKPTQEDLLSNSFDKEGYIDFDWLQSIVKEKNASYYFCGPIPFMKTVNKIIEKMEIPEDKIHFEFFGPADQLN